MTETSNVNHGCESTRGTVVSPNVVFAFLIRNMKALGLTATEVILLEYLLSYVSEGDSCVSPSLKEMHRATDYFSTDTKPREPKKQPPKVDDESGQNAKK